MPFGSHAFLNQQTRYFWRLPDMQMQSDPKKVAMVHFRVDYTIYGTRPQVKVNIMHDKRMNDYPLSILFLLYFIFLSF